MMLQEHKIISTLAGSLTLPQAETIRKFWDAMSQRCQEQKKTIDLIQVAELLAARLKISLDDVLSEIQNIISNKDEPKVKENEEGYFRELTAKFCPVLSSKGMTLKNRADLVTRINSSEQLEAAKYLILQSKDLSEGAKMILLDVITAIIENGRGVLKDSAKSCLDTILREPVQNNITEDIRIRSIQCLEKVERSKPFIKIFLTNQMHDSRPKVQAYVQGLISRPTN
jgi:hypothetical protein